MIAGNECGYSRIRIGTRRSALAFAFARMVHNLIAIAAPSCLVEITTHTSEADRIPGSLMEFGGKRTFVKDLERRLLRKEIDLAVHSLKDIPGDLPMHEDLMIGAYLRRNDPRDCLIMRSGCVEGRLADAGVVIGTSSPRRQQILHRWLPKARTDLIRGNIETRLRKLDSGLFDALILGASGFDILDLQARIARRFSRDEFLPAIGQGTICIQVRRVDRERLGFLDRVNDADTEYCSVAERQILSILQGDCRSAIAGLCELDHMTGEACLHAAVFDRNSNGIVSSRAVRPLERFSPRDLGELVGMDLLEQGASRFL